MCEFQDFFTEVDPVYLRDPLSELLGAFKTNNTIMEYKFTDVIKMAGHPCPTVSAAYICCKKALKLLYPDGIPVRGDIEVTVYGEEDEGVYGVFAQVFSFLTGAASKTGFKGLGHRFKRKDLLKFKKEKPEEDAMCFEFKRLDSNDSVFVKFYPGNVPFPAERSLRLKYLLEKVLWDAAKENEKRDFQELWLEKVRIMLIEEKEIDKWLKLEIRR